MLAFPAWDCLPYDRVSPNPEIAAARMATLAALARGFDRPAAVLTTVNAATQRVPGREVLAGASFVAAVGARVDVAALRGYLARMGYGQAPTVTEPGEFAVRGGLIDLWPPGTKAPVRLDLFGDVLDSAKAFDPETQRTTGSVKRIELAPVSEVILDEASIQRFRTRYRAMFGAAGHDDPLYEAVSAGRKLQGYEHWLPFFHERLDTLFDYLPGAAVLLDEQVGTARGARWAALADQYDARAAALAAKSKLGTVYKPVPPAELYLDDAGWEAAVAGRPLHQLSVLPQPLGPGVIDAGGRIGRDFAPERQQERVSLFGALAAHVATRRKAGDVVIASYSAGARERLAGLLADAGVADAREVGRAADLRGEVNKPGGLGLAVWPLEHGFEAPGLTVVSEQDVLGDRLIRAPRRRRRAENFLTEAAGLTPGDLVVHVDHGIGRYRGLETITAMGAPHECLWIEYAGGDKLFLPVENIELLTRYGHEEGLLDRLGGGAWQAKKAKLKARIRDMADRLIRLAAERALRKGAVLTPPDHHAWEEFCARFPYAETEDQLNAIADVLGDLKSGAPMDRLICGDVGFGKTEVALRAAFVTAMSGMQVAVIAPTTLLARQHFRSFSERFRGLPVRVRRLSRFVGAKEAEETRTGLADGTVEIVVGTHALLAKSVRFKNLGLLVIDEEQHFGVAHKERLKALRSDVHVLTLTATPIPRTLQLALSGVRELSLIATPPVDRLAIRTYVSELDPVTVREALLREHYRGGQSFYVVPRIADLPEVEAFLREQVPEVKFVVAHGQMAAGELDERMNAFYDGRFDVLLSTTIIESGLDIPAANTLVVERADMFGLAQLYQIRGRVGRSKLRAYAFFMTEPRKPLTPQAEKRLRVLGALELARGRVHAGEPGPRHPRRRQPARRGAEWPRPRGRVRTLPGDAGGGDRQASLRRGRAGRRGRMVAADQSRGAGADPRGLRAGSRRAARALPAAVGAGAEGGDGGLRRRADRPLRAAAGGDRHAAPRRPDQGALQARRHRAARRRAEGRHRAVPRRQVCEPGRAGRVPQRPARRRKDQGQQAGDPPRVGGREGAARRRLLYRPRPRRVGEAAGGGGAHGLISRAAAPRRRRRPGRGRCRAAGGRRAGAAAARRGRSPSGAAGGGASAR